MILFSSIWRIILLLLGKLLTLNLYGDSWLLHNKSWRGVHLVSHLHLRLHLRHVSHLHGLLLLIVSSSLHLRKAHLLRYHLLLLHYRILLLLHHHWLLLLLLLLLDYLLLLLNWSLFLFNLFNFISFRLNTYFPCLFILI